MTSDPLLQEHIELRQQARKGRREFARSAASAFVKGMNGAMDDYRQVRAEGVSRDDGCKGLEAVLRSFWPKPTSKFNAACDACDDTGWSEHLCWSDHRCGRRWCEAASSAHQHRYVTPCYCQKGQQRIPPTVTQDHDIAAVGKVAKKRGGFGRF